MSGGGATGGRGWAPFLNDAGTSCALADMMRVPECRPGGGRSQLGKLKLTHGTERNENIS